MRQDDWIEDDVNFARMAVERAIRTCPACRAVWDLSIPSRRLWHETIRCPRCGVPSVRDRRRRALWFWNLLRRVVDPREGDRHG